MEALGTCRGRRVLPGRQRVHAARRWPRVEGRRHRRCGAVERGAQPVADTVRHAVIMDVHAAAHKHNAPHCTNTLPASSRGSVAEWLACWTRAQKGPGSNRSRHAVG